MLIWNFYLIVFIWVDCLFCLFGRVAFFPILILHAMLFEYLYPPSYLFLEAHFLAFQFDFPDKPDIICHIEIAMFIIPVEQRIITIIKLNHIFFLLK